MSIWVMYSYSPGFSASSHMIFSSKFVYGLLWKIVKKINFVQKGWKLAGRFIFSRWFRISNSKNRPTIITWVMADFRNFNPCGHFCRFSSSTWESLSTLWYMFLDAKKPADYKYIVQIDKAYVNFGLIVDFLKKMWKKVTFWGKNSVKIFLEFFSNFLWCQKKEQDRVHHIRLLTLLMLNPRWTPNRTFEAHFGSAVPFHTNDGNFFCYSFWLSTI